MTTETQIPQPAVDALVKLRQLHYEYTDVMRRIGTYGERGLHPTRKSLISKMTKAREAFNKSFPEFTIVACDTFDKYYIRKVS